MKKHSFVLAIAGMVSACATMEAPHEQTASFQNAVYVVGDASAPVQAMPQSLNATPGAANADASKMDTSAVKRLYWFFAGR